VIEMTRLMRGASISGFLITPSSATGRMAAHASANQITPRIAWTAPTSVIAITASSKTVSRRRERDSATSRTAIVARM
jgi:hypothetical protein